jgi:hypothetical protein
VAAGVLQALRRRVAETAPDSDFRELLLQILDEMIRERHKERTTTE